MTLLRTTLAAAVVAASIAAAPAAFALSSTQTVTVGGGSAATQKTDVGTALGANNPLAPFSSAVALFNPTMILATQPVGTTVMLNDVQFAYQVTARTGGTVTNNAAGPQSFRFNLGLQTALDGSANTPAPIINAFGSIGTNAIAMNFAQGVYSNLAGGASAPYPTGTNPTSVTSPTALVIDTTPGDFAAFTGPGSFTLNLDTLAAQTFSGGGGNTAAALNTFAGASFIITYDYTLNAPPVVPVPEPTTIALLGAGLIGLGLVRRRKNG